MMKMKRKMIMIAMTMRDEIIMPVKEYPTPQLSVKIVRIRRGDEVRWCGTLHVLASPNTFI